MSKIKSFIIHSFGGFTKEEIASVRRSSEFLSKIETLGKLKIFMDAMYGIEPDRWCDEVYKRVVKEISDESKKYLFKNN